jgi:hypothetical protein
MNDESTAESRLLDAHPGLRERVGALPEFAAWRRGLRNLVVDGEKFYVIGGDQLKDPDQVIVVWIRLFRPDLLREGHSK